MVKIVDLSDGAFAVETRNGETLEGKGIGFDDIIALLEKFPALEQLLIEQNLRKPMEMKDMLKMAGPALGAILAAGVGKGGDRATEDAMRNLGLGTQAALFRRILERTLPDGLDPFVEDLKAFGILADLDATSKGQDMRSPSPQPGSSNMGTAVETSAATLPEKSSPGENSEIAAA